MDHMNCTTRRIVEGFQAMNIAIQDAGGILPSIKDLEKRTAFELVSDLAMNHIHFKFEKPDESK